MKRSWTEDEISYLKENWDKVRIEDMDLDRTKVAIRTKAERLNLGHNRLVKKKTWTEEDLEYLMNSWGSVSMATIAKNLKRSKGSVQQKASKLGLGPFLSAGEYLTLNKLLNEVRGTYVGKEYTIKSWRDKGLPVKKRRVKNCSFDVIFLQDWWDWAEANSTLIDFSKLEPLALGEEPKWLKEQRRADQERRMQFKTTDWTKVEDRLLIELLNSYKYTYRELSIRLRRTEGAIKRRMIYLKVKARPLKMPNHNPWTKEEVERLIELYHKGHSPPTMANYINRSSQACSGKIERLIKERRIFPRNEHRVSC